MHHNLVRTGTRKCFDTGVRRTSWEIWSSAHRLVFYYHPQSSKTKFHISCCGAESNSKLKFIFRVAAISGLILSFRGDEIPKPGSQRRPWYEWMFSPIPIPQSKLFINFYLSVYLSNAFNVWGQKCCTADHWARFDIMLLYYLSVLGFAFVMVMDSCIHSLMSQMDWRLTVNWLSLSCTHSWRVCQRGSWDECLVVKAACPL